MAKIETAYTIILRTERYAKLFAIQTMPCEKYWFKDKEVSIIN